jgi:hypothetical protein
MAVRAVPTTRRADLELHSGAAAAGGVLETIQTERAATVRRAVPLSIGFHRLAF